ncbi:MAG TPA: MOSC N-terminal beta barrel domain-containing protein [Candidatus Methylacidiphilales bacterium]|nr:MOSC N-terminal beta barrel domain-containing protein [Candidatus Methylacidiphilales bacterium]
MVLGRIIIYPIKSLDGMCVDEARMTEGGILEFDRIHAIVDEKGAYVNGKRTPRVQLLRTEYLPGFQEIRIGVTGEATRHHFSLRDPAPLNRWLSDFFGFTVSLASETKSGFPDDRTAFGPTITSEASLREVAGWFPEVSLKSVRRRFRGNLELTGGDPFWEDHLFSKPGELKPFQIGDVRFLGHNPCQRCVVPVRDPDSADPIPNFQKTFMERRKETLPPWAEKERFNHYYRFAINTSVPATETGKILRTGDSVQISA